MKLHHIGKVVKDIALARSEYEDLFDFKAQGDPVLDPIQKVHVLLLASGDGSGPSLELVSPVGPESPVYKFLLEGGGLHHLCFEVADIQDAVDNLRAKGALVLGKPSPGEGHGGRLTAWIYTSRRELVELVEEG